MKYRPNLPVVLFVDDDPDILEGVANSLRHEPCRVLTAKSARKALSVLKRYAVDVIVCDEQMPQVTGSELLVEVCARYPGTVRLMLTGQASVNAAVRAINEGRIFRLLTKPLSAGDLRRNIRDALHVAQIPADDSAPPRRVDPRRMAQDSPSIIERSLRATVVFPRNPSYSSELRVLIEPTLPPPSIA